LRLAGLICISCIESIRRCRLKTSSEHEDFAGARKDQHIGLSEVSARQIQHARTIVPIVTVQNRFSVTDRGSEDVLAYCEKRKWLYSVVPLAAGRISGSESPISRLAARWKATPSQVALAWLLARSPVILPIQELPGSNISKKMWRHPELRLTLNKMQELDRMAVSS